jgi:hypothetical protein
MRKLFLIPFAVFAINAAQAQPVKPPAPAAQPPAEMQAAKELIDHIQPHLDGKYPGNASLYNQVAERLLLCGAVYTALSERSSMADATNRQRLQFAGRALGSASRVLFKGSDAEFTVIAEKVLESDLQAVMADKQRATGLLKNCQGFTNPADLENAVGNLISEEG